MNKKITIGAIVFIVIISIATKLRGPYSAVNQNTDRNSASLPVAAGKNSVSVDDQAVGNSVMVSSVIMEKKGFVVIHEKDNESLGKIIGSSALFEAGESNNVSISLREPLQGGKKYLAVLDIDNGDGVFRPGVDHPVMSNDGNGGALKIEFSVK
jgi:hypothetical protein